MNPHYTKILNLFATEQPRRGESFSKQFERIARDVCGHGTQDEDWVWNRIGDLYSDFESTGDWIDSFRDKKTLLLALRGVKLWRPIRPFHFRYSNGGEVIKTWTGKWLVYDSEGGLSKHAFHTLRAAKLAVVGS